MQTNNNLSLDQNEDQEALLNNSQHLETLEKIFKITDIFDVIFFIGIISFLIVLTLKLALPTKFSWFYLLTPSVVAIIAFSISTNLFIQAIDIGKKSKSWFMYLSVNVASVSTVSYLIVFCLKMEKVIMTNWMIISIPLFITLFIAGLHLLYKLPIHLNDKSYFEIVLLSVYFISFTVFTGFIHHKIDYITSKDEPSFLNIFIVLFIGTGLHLVYSIYYIFKYKERSLIERILKFVSVLLLISSLILMVLILNISSTNLQSFYPAMLLLFSYISFSFYRIYETFQK